jgi:alkylated DNA nucleotide flippase Atl1
MAPILRTTLEVLRDAGRPLQPGEVREAVAARVAIAEDQQEINAHGQPRWWAQLGFRTGEAASLGWMTKRNGWAITQAGTRVLDEHPGTELYHELVRQYRARRLPAQGRTFADPRWRVVLDALTRVTPGTWTTYGDLADLVGMSAQSVGGFMAESPDAEHTHRVLQSGGRISPQFRWPDPERADDPRAVLRGEGLRFDQAGRADPSQRLTADDLRRMLSEAGTLPDTTGDAVPAPRRDDTPAAFEQFQLNLSYARQLVHGGRNLKRLGVGAFDVTDLYRAAWTQAVAALDHWVTREIIDRALALALRPRTTRPPKFNNLSIPVELFERIHHHEEPLEDSFRQYLEQHFGFMTFQNPDDIKRGFAHVSTVNLWVKVARSLTDQDPTTPVTADAVRGRLQSIARRRNNIAHTADHDAERPGQKTPVTAPEVEATIDWLESIAIAIQQALGDPPPAVDYDTAPAEAGALGTVPVPTHERRADGTRRPDTWDESDVLQAIEEFCPADVARTLLTVYRHAEAHPSFQEYYFGKGKYPSVTASFNLGSDKSSVWTIYTGSVKSILAVNFGVMRTHGASRERMARLADHLSVLPGWTTVRTQLDSTGYTKYPSLQPVALAHPQAPEIIITALNEFLSPDA